VNATSSKPSWASYTADIYPGYAEKITTVMPISANDTNNSAGSTEHVPQVREATVSRIRIIKRKNTALTMNTRATNREGVSRLMLREMD
jgi:hypothetical protein